MTMALLIFLVFISITLVITYWAARRTSTTEHFYAAGRTVSPAQNGLALAGDYMSAASFLGIAGLVSTTGFDGLIYSTGWLVGWPVVLFLIAEPLRNLGDVRVIGGVGVIELVSDKNTRQADRYLDGIGPRLAAAFLERGLLLRPLGNIVYFMPPYVITDDEVEWALTQIEEVVTAAAIGP